MAGLLIFTLNLMPDGFMPDLMASGLRPDLMASRAAAAEAPLVTDPNTGLAISGFDPVAYFVDGRAEIGRPAFELSRDGAVWRFANAGNLAAFAEYAEVYRPRFGGYDPVAIAGDRSVAGHPMFWALVSERLYLFYSAANREAFLADPGHVLQMAERRWPAVERTIAR